jgi:hypothetical protein
MTQDLGGAAQLITALVLAATFVQSFLNGRKSARIEKAQTAIKENVQTIEKATNSMKDALVAATARASHAEGAAEGLAQGRQETVKPDAKG